MAGTPKRWRWLLEVMAVGLLVTMLPALILELWGPSILGRALSTYLHTSVTVQQVTGGWWSGVTVHQLTIAEDLTPQAPVLARIDTLRLNLPLVFLLLPGKPIPVRVETVHIDLRQRQDGQWNVMPFVQTLRAHKPAPSDARVIAPQLDRMLTVTVTRG